jgi:hypothetical protein
MNTKIITSAVALFALAFVLTSCSSSKTTTKKYPAEKTTTPNSTNLPPGQAKKVYGTKSAKVFAPGQQKKQGKYYPLIIVRTPAIVILRHADGRYYYKNEENYIYWQGNDDRFYLDEQYLEKVQYDKNELESWKHKGNTGNARKTPPGQSKKDESNEQHGNGNGNANGNGKGKSKNH